MALDPTDPAYPVRPIEPGDPVEPAQPVEYAPAPPPDRPTEPMGVDEPVGAVQRPQYVERDRTVEYARPVEYVQPVRPSGYDNRGWWRTYRAARIVYLVFGIIETLILIRVILKLLAANPNAGFSAFIYALTAPFVAPFAGVFPTPSGGGSVLELSSILAILVYILLAWVIVRIIDIVNRRRPPVAAV